MAGESKADREVEVMKPVCPKCGGTDLRFWSNAESIGGKLLIICGVHCSNKHEFSIRSVDQFAQFFPSPLEVVSYYLPISPPPDVPQIITEKRIMQGNKKRVGTIHEHEHLWTIACYAPPKCKRPAPPEGQSKEQP